MKISTKYYEIGPSDMSGELYLELHRPIQVTRDNLEFLIKLLEKDIDYLYD